MRQSLIKKLLVSTILIGLSATSSAYGMLAGGRPNAFSEGNNAFAGVVNPANAVWIADRFDVGAFWVNQKSTLDNKDNNPLFSPGKISLTHKAKNIFTADVAIHKHVKFNVCGKSYDSSVTLAAYTLPSVVKLGTKRPIPIVGTTPLRLRDMTNVISAVFSLKLNASHSIGFSIDYLHLSHRRDGFQNSDNPIRSVSPGNVTNRGYDHSSGIGFSLGWRWKITERLNFGAAWIKKSYAGQYRKYRGYEPHHAHNYIPQSVGGGFSYRFTSKIAGRLEVLWSNLGNVPNSNNSVLSNGRLNRNKRGSNKSPGPGLQDATFINAGLGYRMNSVLTLGVGLSHRIKLKQSSNFVSHSYRRQTIYDVVSLGAHLNHKKHELFLVFSHGFNNRVSGVLPIEIGGGGRFVSEKENNSFSASYGYRY